ncbi:hypothetical protein GQF42_15970 [Streptomyces broussonetiae]|uniref:Uncharacterized protein n=1 Tax=Streptomyces broussonetiae TaxID=2686304 RepID=A0A6I6N7Y4_9ACTN|nr:hypothetical protein [Streptomyces broussonetiae]QHA04587.1 hypothetical protein GQF42_15970 [Streptomyces broussonetiae]
MTVRCPECGEPLQRVQPDDWIAAWGPVPEWSHFDGSSLCPVIGDNGYEPAQPEFRP